MSTGQRAINKSSNHTKTQPTDERMNERGKATFSFRIIERKYRKDESAELRRCRWQKQNLNNIFDWAFHIDSTEGPQLVNIILSEILLVYFAI